MGCRNVALHSLRNWAQKQNAKYVWHLLKHKDLQASSKMVQTCPVFYTVHYRLHSLQIHLCDSEMFNYCKRKVVKIFRDIFSYLDLGHYSKKTFFYKHTIQSAFIIYSSCYLLSDIYQQAGDFFPG